MKTNLEARASRLSRTAAWTALAAGLAGFWAYTTARADDLPPVPAPEPAPAWSPFASPGGPPGAPPVGPIGVPPPPAPVPAPGAGDLQAPPVHRLTKDQLLELVGPIALYPDVVLSALLPATAFPLDVVGAARFAREHKSAPAGAPADAGWDASVQALMQYPDILFWLDENIPWLQQMGEAVATQQPDVLAAIQEFRRRADAAGNLPTNDKQRVIVRAPAEQAAPQIIEIQPANPEIVYVPVYDPYVVCQPSPWWSIGPCVSWGLGFGFGFGGPWACHDFDWWGWNSYSNGYCGSIRSYGAPYRWHGGSQHYTSGLYGPQVWSAPSHGYGTGYGAVYGAGSARHYAGGAYAPRAGAAALAGGDPRLTVRTPSRPTWGRTSAPVLRSGTDVAAPTPRTYGPRMGGAGLAAASGAGGPAYAPTRTTRAAPKLDGPTASPYRYGGAAGGTAARSGPVAPFGAGPGTVPSTTTRGNRSWSPGNTPRWDMPRTDTARNPGFGASGSGPVGGASNGNPGSTYAPRTVPTPSAVPNAAPQVSRTTRTWGGAGSTWVNGSGWNGSAPAKVNGGAPAATTWGGTQAPAQRWQPAPRYDRPMTAPIPTAPTIRTPSAPKWSAPSSPSQPTFKSGSWGGSSGGWGRQSHGNDYTPPPPPSRRR